jgi:hypothetical protein
MGNKAVLYIATSLDGFVAVPVILGDGIPLVGETPESMELSLRDVRQFDKGLVQLTYEPER